MAFGKSVPINKPNSYSLREWIDAAEKSNNFDSYKVYVVKVSNKKETFYKIGKTFTTTKQRLKSFPYRYEIIEEYEGNPFRISRLEKKLHRLSKEYKYTPLKQFAGSTECFSQINEYEKK